MTAKLTALTASPRPLRRTGRFGDGSEQPDVSDRQAMIEYYYPLVQTIAKRLARKLPAHVEVDELVHEGVLGLIDAIDRYDASRKVPFKSYAEIRIHGAMVDALRSDDIVPRSVRRKNTELENARSYLSFKNRRAPSRDEMVAYLGISESDYESMLRDSLIRRSVSLDVSTTEDGQTPLVESIAAETEHAEDIVGSRELRKALVHAVSCLPEKERVAVSLSFMNEMTLREIGEQLGVTESRACQLRGAGVKRLTYRLRRSVQ
jgi:RNA polymerase sigma factor for flagellar operon FliA